MIFCPVAGSVGIRSVSRALSLGFALMRVDKLVLPVLWFFAFLFLDFRCVQPAKFFQLQAQAVPERTLRAQLVEERLGLLEGIG